jgi:hypothetical protein
MTIRLWACMAAAGCVSAGEGAPQLDGGGLADASPPSSSASWAARCARVPSHPGARVTCPCVDTLRAGFDDPALDCLLCGLHRCQPTTGGVWQDFGETFLEVMGADGGQCVVRLRGEIEGGNDVHLCRLPLGLEPWRELVNPTMFAGIPAALAPHCTRVERCNPDLGVSCREAYPLCR